MSNIVSSAYAVSVQADGRLQVHERHTDLVAVVHDICYLAGANDDLNAALAVHATNLGNDLAAAEVAYNFALVASQGKLSVPIGIYSTAAQNAANLVAAWPTVLNDQAIFIGEYMNGLTNAVLQSTFGWTLLQATSARADYLVPYAALAASIRSAQGGLF